jgi:hypothetical protein
MKVYIMIVLLFAAAFGASILEKEGQIHFEHDSSPESPIGLLMKGLINPQDKSQNTVATFFRLAEQLIPLAQSTMDAEKPGNLQWSRSWCVGNLGDAFSLCFFANAELWVGWRVTQLGETGSYNLTYTPYSYFRVGGNASASSYPAEVSIGAYFSVYDVQLPVNLLLAQSQICYSARFALLPTSAYTSVNTNLLQCQRSVPDMTPWACDKIQGIEFRLSEFRFTDGLFINLLPYTCINF